MPIWLAVLCLLVIIVIIVLMPSKSIFRWVKVGLYVLVAIAVLYLIAAFLFLGGID